MKLKKFSLTYVLCKHCGNPETHLEVKPAELFFACSACGGEFSLPKSESYPLVKMLCREAFKP